jgi:hypothetical protein
MNLLGLVWTASSSVSRFPLLTSCWRPATSLIHSNTEQGSSKCFKFSYTRTHMYVFLILSTIFYDVMHLLFSSFMSRFVRRVCSKWTSRQSTDVRSRQTLLKILHAVYCLEAPLHVFRISRHLPHYDSVTPAEGWILVCVWVWTVCSLLRDVNYYEQSGQTTKVTYNFSSAKMNKNVLRRDKDPCSLHRFAWQQTAFLHSWSNGLLYTERPLKTLPKVKTESASN